MKGQKKHTTTTTKDDSQIEKKKIRGILFTEEETDLLLTLLLSSDLLSQGTNKMTPYGRIETWQNIHRIFNASPGFTTHTCVFSLLFLLCSVCLFLFSFFCCSNAKKKFCVPVRITSAPGWVNWTRLRRRWFRQRAADCCHHRIHPPCRSNWHQLFSNMLQPWPWKFLVCHHVAIAMRHPHQHHTKRYRNRNRCHLQYHTKRYRSCSMRQQIPCHRQMP